MPGEEMSRTELSRRDCLKWGGLLASTSVWRPAIASAGEAALRSKKACILVYLLGGPPHLDMFDLKPNAPKEVRGPFQPIATNLAGVQICEHLPKLSQM